MSAGSEVKPTKSCRPMVTYPKYQTGSEIGDNILDTAVGVQRNPYQGYFCGNQNMGKGKLADQLLPTQTYTTSLGTGNTQN